MRMKRIIYLAVLVVVLFEIQVMLFCRGVSAGERSSWMEVRVKRGCSGGIGECVWEPEMEMELESEISRRVLVGQKKYISYESLSRDKVPCSTPGAPYYNCHAHERANTYTRGCEIITGCARDIKF